MCSGSRGNHSWRLLNGRDSVRLRVHVADTSVRAYTPSPVPLLIGSSDRMRDVPHVYPLHAHRRPESRRL